MHAKHPLIITVYHLEFVFDSITFQMLGYKVEVFLCFGKLKTPKIPTVSKPLVILACVWRPCKFRYLFMLKMWV